MAKLKQRLHHVRTEEQLIINCQLERSGIDIIRGNARFFDSNTVIIDLLGTNQEIRMRGASES